MNSLITVVLFAVTSGLVLMTYSYLQKVSKTRKSLAEITGYVAALGLVWLSFSLCMGLLITFDILEATGDTKILSAFEEGFAFAMKLIAGGVGVVCVPLVGYLSSEF